MNCRDCHCWNCKHYEECAAVHQTACELCDPEHQYERWICEHWEEQTDD